MLIKIYLIEGVFLSFIGKVRVGVIVFGYNKVVYFIIL